MSGQQRIRRQAQEQPYPQGQCISEDSSGGGRPVGSESQGHIPERQVYRLKARRGYKRAAVAVAHKILVAIYHMLSNQVSYNDLGDLYLDTLNKHQVTRNLVRRLERLGYTVTLEEKAA